MGVEEFQHRPGTLKQQNKPHKHGRHRSKGSLEKLNKGRAHLYKAHSSKRHELSKEQRRNQASQIRSKKRFEYLQQRRGLIDTPILLVFVPLSESVNVSDTVSLIKGADPDVVVKDSPTCTHLSMPRLKQKFTIVESGGDNLFDVLDLLKVADTVVFLVSAEGLSEFGQITLTAAVAQGLPSCSSVCVDLDSVPLKKRQQVKAQLQHDLDSWLPGEKVHGLGEGVGDALMLMRRIATQKQRKVYLRDHRPHLMSDRVEFIETSKGSGVLKVSGYLQGKTLSVNSLVHIPGWGDFQMSKIECSPDPFGEKQESKILALADPLKQESLRSENTVDEMDAEQTWPTEEDIAAANDERREKRKMKKIPHGMSDYQAAWIPDEDAVELESEDECSEGEEMEAASDSDKSSEAGDNEEMDVETLASEDVPPPDKYDTEMDLLEEENELKKVKEAEQDKEFPDEMDTPRDIAASERFARYRGLASFRTTPWDPRENLPRDYARIFQFQNFARTRKSVLQEQEETDGAEAGWYITVHIEGVPTYMWRTHDLHRPLTVYGLLKHEQKMSVVNMVLRRPATLASDVPIKSKEPLLIQCGYRRYRCRPVFSQHTKGNKFKYERFFQVDSVVVATTYAPVVFPPSPVLAFTENSDGTSTLAAIGSVLSVDPNRVIVKRVTLSGHPYKVHKRSAVIRFMFFNRDDINWFKPVELRTKYGRRGHIKEPLGTHGHMKCVFNNQLKSQDTVLLHLYKRVFPKWTYDPRVLFCVEEKPEDGNKSV